MILNCIAVDDEPLALEKIKSFVERVPFLKLISCCNNAMEAISELKNSKIDLIFLDIQMDEFTGIQLLESLQTKPKVILTTAYDSYALKGYELDVSDYLLKPISFERFLKAVNKVYDNCNAKSDKETNITIQDSKQNKEDFVFVKTEYRMQKVVFDDILYIEGMKDYLRIVTKSEKIMTLQSFSSLEKLLPSHDFVRVHKSYIVAINKIECIERRGIKIKEMYIPIGDIYKMNFMDILKQRGLI